MHRTRPSLSYDFLVGDLLSANMSSILVSLNYFPPPPPFILGPPPRRSWKCPTRSCLTGDDRYLPIIHPHVPIRDSNQPMSPDMTSPNSIPPQKLFPSSSLLKTILEFLQNPSIIILLLILISIIFLLLFILIPILCWQRRRQQQQQRSQNQQTFSISSNSHPITHNNSTNNTELNFTKQEAFYHRLIPYHRKHSKRLSITTKIDSIRLRNHHQRDSPVPEVVRLSIAIDPKNDQSECEEAL